MSSQQKQSAANAPSVPISGIWVRNSLNTVQVLVEFNGQWRLVAEEPLDGAFSHIVEPGGIVSSPLAK